MKTSTTLYFGDITFDPGRRLAFRGPHQIRLTPRAFDLLELLLGRRPNAIPKHEILESVWRGTFVTEGTLAALVKDLRKALGEDARTPSLIRTVFGYGYAFEGAVLEAPQPESAPHLHLLVWSGKAMKLAEGPNLVGRESPAGIRIGHPSVSREHARILVTAERAEIEDLGSKNGTWCGETRISGRVPLCDGDDVRVGTVRLTYRGPASRYPGDTRTFD